VWEERRGEKNSWKGKVKRNAPRAQREKGKREKL
jgi:hypothetical protein